MLITDATILAWGGRVVEELAAAIGGGRVFIDSDHQVIRVVIGKRCIQGYLYPASFSGDIQLPIEDLHHFIHGNPIPVTVKSIPLHVTHIHHPIAGVGSDTPTIPVIA